MQVALFFLASLTIRDLNLKFIKLNDENGKVQVQDLSLMLSNIPQISSLKLT
jgi:hypothetical protein